MEIAKSIESSVLNELPLKAYDGEITLVADTETFHQAIAELRQCKVLGFDTETRPSFKKGVVNQVSLLQLATRYRVYLFRLNKIGLPDELIKILSNQSVVKAGLAIHDDLKSLIDLKKFKPKGFVDIQDMVRKLEFENFSLKKITAIVLGFRISKSQQLSNWDADLLTEPQQLYAATDAWVSLKVYEKLLNGLG